MVDKISYDFVKGSSVDYVEELIRSAFQVSCLCLGRFALMYFMNCRLHNFPVKSLCDPIF